MLDIDEESLTSLMVLEFGKTLVEVRTIVSPAISPVPRSLPVSAIVLFNCNVLDVFNADCCPMMVQLSCRFSSCAACPVARFTMFCTGSDCLAAISRDRINTSYRL